MVSFERNIGILSEAEQGKLASAKVAVIGLGMGSVVCEQLARLGVGQLTIIDGDTVADSNLNRQIYVQGDVGKLKSEALARRLREINPKINVNIVNKYLSEPDLDIFTDSDLIVDSIDLSSFLIIKKLHVWASSRKKKIIFPINLGWKSIVYVFSEDSMSIEDLLKLDSSEIESNDFKSWVRFLGTIVPEYGLERFSDFVKNAERMDDWCPAPQIAPTVFATASLVSACVTRIIVGEEVKLAPDKYETDLFLA